MKAWYFGYQDRRLGYNDNREIKIGETHIMTWPYDNYYAPTLCSAGLHGSRNILDALLYAKGPIVYRVNITGRIDRKKDKLCGDKRTYLAGGIDITAILQKFARMCALDVINLWDAPQIVKDFLNKGDKKNAVEAHDAAYSAARAGAYAVAYAAAHAADAAAYAAYAAAAAHDAAHDAVYAARAAARGARDAHVYAHDADASNTYNVYLKAAQQKQNKRLSRMVNNALKGAPNETINA